MKNRKNENPITGKWIDRKINFHLNLSSRPVERNSAMLSDGQKKLKEE
jgi:hypothetical protein